MDFFIQKIFYQQVDSLVHLQFQKFSKGSYKGRALVKASNSKGMYSIGTTNEYANELVRALAVKLGNQATRVTGVIVSTKDLKDKLKFKDLKQFMGIKQYVIDEDMTGHSLVSLCDNFPTAFLALSFKTADSELKIKPKAPKSAKPSTSEKGPSADFCKLKTSDAKLANGLVFDAADWKKAEITHTFDIKDIRVPKGEIDPLKLRENAVRIGKIIRKAVVDEKQLGKEEAFEA